MSDVEEKLNETAKVVTSAKNLFLMMVAGLTAAFIAGGISFNFMQQIWSTPDNVRVLNERMGELQRIIQELEPLKPAVARLEEGPWREDVSHVSARLSELEKRPYAADGKTLLVGGSRVRIRFGDGGGSRILASTGTPLENGFAVANAPISTEHDGTTWILELVE